MLLRIRSWKKITKSVRRFETNSKIRNAKRWQYVFFPYNLPWIMHIEICTKCRLFENNTKFGLKSHVRNFLCTRVCISISYKCIYVVSYLNNCVSCVCITLIYQTIFNLLISNLLLFTFENIWYLYKQHRKRFQF